MRLSGTSPCAPRPTSPAILRSKSAPVPGSRTFPSRRHLRERRRLASASRLARRAESRRQARFSSSGGGFERRHAHVTRPERGDAWPARFLQPWCSSPARERRTPKWLRSSTRPSAAAARSGCARCALAARRAAPTGFEAGTGRCRRSRRGREPLSDGSSRALVAGPLYRAAPGRMRKSTPSRLKY